MPPVKTGPSGPTARWAAHVESVPRSTIASGRDGADALGSRHRSRSMVCEEQEYAVRGLGTHEGHRETRLMLFPRDDADHPLARSFRHFLQDPEFPCVGAKSALSRDRIKIVVARDLTSGWDDLRVYPPLLAFVSRYKRDPRLIPQLCDHLRDADELV